MPRHGDVHAMHMCEHVTHICTHRHICAYVFTYTHASAHVCTQAHAVYLCSHLHTAVSLYMWGSSPKADLALLLTHLVSLSQAPDSVPRWDAWDFPGGPVAKTLHSPCRGPGLIPGQGSSFPGGSAVKNPLVNEGGAGSIPGSGSSPGEGNGSPRQYSCLGNPMDRGAWWATVHGVAKVSDTISD